jgi:ferric-dicitrate binding protein FerR (iron transport regulator)
MSDLAEHPEHRLTLYQADQAWNDFATILDELDFLKGQLARRPARAYICRMLPLATAGACALLAAVVLWLAP